jgi:hypothetical protein
MPTERITERIPPADEVRKALADNLKESRLLRQMLKLSEKAERAVREASEEIQRSQQGALAEIERRRRK